MGLGWLHSPWVVPCGRRFRICHRSESGVCMVSVLLCSIDTSLSRLLGWNLSRRGYDVRHAKWDPYYETAEAPPVLADADIVISDLSCPEPDCWVAASRVRQLAETLPVVILAYCWPDERQLRALHPCIYLRKPCAVDELLKALRDLELATG